MPRPVPKQKLLKMKVDVKTHKCSGAHIRCRGCRYEGPADVVIISKAKTLDRGMERCPECKSLNIICLEDELMDDVKEPEWDVDEWVGCYPSDWRNVLVPGAMAHPAKFSSKLIRNIYVHLFEEGWVKEKDTVLDPFGGIALGALNAMEMGLSWVGNELEPNFQELGEHNIAHWNVKYKDMPRWSGKAHLFQGDSRRLLDVIRGADVSVSSPPYKNATEGQGLNVNKPESFRGVLKDGSLSMGDSEGNLGQMNDANFEAAVSSPPFRQSDGGTPEPKAGGAIDDALYARHAAGNGNANGYGETDGQLANMKEGDFDASVSSPPYSDSVNQSDSDNDSENRLKRMEAVGIDTTKKNNVGGPNGSMNTLQTYGYSDGQLGAMKSKTPLERANEDVEKILTQKATDDFWMAARQIVEQVYQALTPGGHAVWVCKDFVRGGKRVPFSDQWRQLCEAAGFVTVHEHHALLVRGKSKAYKLDGSVEERSKSSKSFFRRLAESKGSPKIDWEVVYCMVKPE